MIKLCEEVLLFIKNICETKEDAKKLELQCRRDVKNRTHNNIDYLITTNSIRQHLKKSLMDWIHVCLDFTDFDVNNMDRVIFDDFVSMVKEATYMNNKMIIDFIQNCPFYEYNVKNIIAKYTDDDVDRIYTEFNNNICVYSYNESVIKKLVENSFHTNKKRKVLQLHSRKVIKENVPSEVGKTNEFTSDLIKARYKSFFNKEPSTYDMYKINKILENKNEMVDFILHHAFLNS